MDTKWISNVDHSDQTEESQNKIKMHKVCTAIEMKINGVCKTQATDKPKDP